MLNRLVSSLAGALPLQPRSLRGDQPRNRPGPAITPDQHRFFHANGYLILPGFIPAETVARIKDHLETLWETRSTQGEVAIDINFGLPDEARLFFRKVPAEARRNPYKILDLHLTDDIIRDACTNLQLTQALKLLLGATPLVCNSLLFEWGSQQYPHFDTFFMPSNTPNMMAASWIALDPVSETNGPLYYYPGSHLIEPFRFSHGRMNAIFSELKTSAAAHIDAIIESHGLRREVFHAQPGDVLIWHAQLLHGGSPILNTSETRKSLVTHYWTEVDYPDEAQRIDLGNNRWVLRKPHQHVVDDDVLAEVDAFLATLSPPPDASSAVPESFDPRLYLARNQDVLRAGESPWQHYINHGRNEGRVW